MLLLLVAVVTAFPAFEHLRLLLLPVPFIYLTPHFHPYHTIHPYTSLVLFCACKHCPKCSQKKCLVSSNSKSRLCHATLAHIHWRDTAHNVCVGNHVHIMCNTICIMQHNNSSFNKPSSNKSHLCHAALADPQWLDTAHSHIHMIHFVLCFSIL